MSEEYAYTVQNEIAKAAKEMNKPVEELKKTYSKERITPYIQIQKAYDLVKNTAVDLNDPEVKAST